jgi:hypothetical protein
MAWRCGVAGLDPRDGSAFAPQRNLDPVWRLYCHLTADANCGTTVYIVVHWSAIAILMLVPVILGWLLAWAIGTVRRRRAG